MSLRQKRIWAAALGLHFFLVINLSLQDLSATLASGARRFPKFFERFLERTEAVTSASVGRQLAVANPVRQLLTTYAECTGIEVGYSYFAPNVPGNSRLAFELHYPDGRVEYDVPVVGGATAGDRVSVLLDRLRFVHYRRLREALLRSLVNSIHHQHPEAVLIRAVLGTAELTTAAEYRAGKRISYNAWYAYDFRYRNEIQPSPKP